MRKRAADRRIRARKEGKCILLRPNPSTPQFFSGILTAKVLKTHFPPALSDAKGQNPSFSVFSLRDTVFRPKTGESYAKPAWLPRPFRTVRRPVFRAPHRTKRSVGRGYLHLLLPVPQLISDEFFKRFSIPTFLESFRKQPVPRRLVRETFCAAGYFARDPAEGSQNPHSQSVRNGFQPVEVVVAHGSGDGRPAGREAPEPPKRGRETKTRSKGEGGRAKSSDPHARERRFDEEVLCAPRLRFCSPRPPPSAWSGRTTQP